MIVCWSFVLGTWGYLDHVRFVTHFPNFGHVSQLLIDQGAFKNYEHEQGEQAVPNIFIEAPQQHAEYLKHKKWCSGSLYEQFLEFWNAHIHPEKNIVFGKSYIKIIKIFKVPLHKNGYVDPIFLYWQIARFHSSSFDMNNSIAQNSTKYVICNPFWVGN